MSNHTMNAMVLEAPGQSLQLRRVPVPVPSQGEVLVKVNACAVCRTDLHVVDGELPGPKLPLIPGHEIAGIVESVGKAVVEWRPGDRVGVPWLGKTCGVCGYCQEGRENLCDHAMFTGYTLDGGYADYTVADARFCLPLPEGLDDVAAAPLLCAGLIGYRCLKKAGNARAIGIYGFGAAAHLITQIARGQGREIYAFTRSGDKAAQDFALGLGAVWAGSSAENAPRPLDAAIIFAPSGDLVPAALKQLAKGGTVVCGGIHMSDIPSFRYADLWSERSICSVANLTRADGREFFELLRRLPVRARTVVFPLNSASDALDRLRRGELTGAAVLVPEPGGK